MLTFIIALLVPPTPADEVARLEAWFAQATAIVEGNRPDLDPDRRARRADLLGALEDYVSGGLFPANPSTAWTSVFVDAADTRCAVAHLLEVTGEADLMWRVAATANRVDVLDLAEDDAFRGWLDWHGLTLAEADAIQPSYPGPRQPTCICGGEDFWDWDQENFVPDAYAMISVAPAGEDLVVVDHHGPNPPREFPVGARFAPTDLGLPALRGAPPWFILATSPTAGEQVPYTDPCPTIVAYPGVPPAPLTHSQIAEALEAGAACADVLTRIDSRWGYAGEGGRFFANGDCRAAPAGDLDPLWLIGLGLIWRRRRSPRRRRAPRRRDRS